MHAYTCSSRRQADSTSALPIGGGGVREETRTSFTHLHGVIAHTCNNRINLLVRLTRSAISNNLGLSFAMRILAHCQWQVGFRVNGLPLERLVFNLKVVMILFPILWPNSNLNIQLRIRVEPKQGSSLNPRDS